MKFKEYVRIVLFVEILFILIELSAFLFIPAKKVFKYGFYELSREEILKEEDNTIDVVALGDSTIYASLSPMNIWKEYGYTVFDVAESARIMKDAYKSLQLSVDAQHPKIVIMEANIIFRDPKKTPRQKLVRKVKREAKQLFTTIVNHDNWKKIGITTGYNNINFTKGYRFITSVDGTKDNNYMKKTNVHKPIPEGNIEYLEKILELCKDNNIRFVMVSMPARQGWYYQKYNSAMEISKKYNLEFIDLNLNNPLNIDWETETKDKGWHLNYKGARKVSKFIGEYLEKTKLLEDHRNDKKYKGWSDAYKAYEKYIEKELEHSKYVQKSM